MRGHAEAHQDRQKKRSGVCRVLRQPSAVPQQHSFAGPILHPPANSSALLLVTCYDLTPMPAPRTDQGSCSSIIGRSVGCQGFE